jgi:hypothetical protein
VTSPTTTPMTGITVPGQGNKPIMRYHAQIGAEPLRRLAEEAGVEIQVDSIEPGTEGANRWVVLVFGGRRATRLFEDAVDAAVARGDFPEDAVVRHTVA